MGNDGSTPGPPAAGLFGREVRALDHRGKVIPLWSPGVLPIGIEPRRYWTLNRREMSRAWSGLGPEGRKHVRNLLWMAGLQALGATIALFGTTRIDGWFLARFVQLGLVAVMLVSAWHTARRLRSAATVAEFLGGEGCASCGYSLAGLPPAPDGCTVCPECGSAWKLPEPSNRQL